MIKHIGLIGLMSLRAGRLRILSACDETGQSPTITEAPNQHDRRSMGDTSRSPARHPHTFTCANLCVHLVPTRFRILPVNAAVATGVRTGSQTPHQQRLPRRSRVSWPIPLPPAMIQAFEHSEQLTPVGAARTAPFLYAKRRLEQSPGRSAFPAAYSVSDVKV